MGSVIGVALRAYRKRRGLTQHELARRAGISVRAVGYIEQGRVTRPRQATILKLAEVTGFDPASTTQCGVRGARVTVGVLGPLTVIRDGRRVDVGSTRQHCVLGLLALRPNETVSLDEIVEMFWDDHPPAGHRNVVHTYIARLRRRLGPVSERGVRIVTGGGGYRLEGTADEIDLMRFDALLAQAGKHTDKRAEYETLSRALQCWRGPVVSDLIPALRDHPAAVEASRRRLFAAERHTELAIELGLHEPPTGNRR